MSKTVFGAIAVLLLSITLTADAAVSEKPITGTYVLYSGDLGDWQDPAANDTKLFLSLDANAAKAVFDAMNDGKKPSIDEDGTETRSRGDVACMHFTAPKDEWACYFAFDLRSGKSIASSIK